MKLFKPLLEIIRLWTIDPVPLQLIRLEWNARARQGRQGYSENPDQLDSVTDAAVKQGVIVEVKNPNGSTSYQLTTTTPQE
jgi:tRNA G18 (ribose-2'-O)-methylase SpoU